MRPLIRFSLCSNLSSRENTRSSEYKKYDYLETTQNKVIKPINYKPNSFGKNVFRQKKNKKYEVKKLQTTVVNQNTKSNYTMWQLAPQNISRQIINRQLFLKLNNSSLKKKKQVIKLKNIAVPGVFVTSSLNSPQTQQNLSSI